MPTHHSFLRARDELFAKIREFGHAAGSRARDAASKSRILVCPIFGCFVGGVPDRVFQNCKKVFSRPRPGLQPLLICLHVRYRTQELRPSTTKVPFFAVRAKFGGLPGQISQHSFYIFFTTKTCSKTSTNLFAHLTTSLRTAAIIKKPENPKKDIIL